MQLLSLAAALVATDRSWTAYADASYAFLPPGVPKALPTQVIVAGRARFTVLTKYLLRLVSPCRLHVLPASPRRALAAT